MRPDRHCALGCVLLAIVWDAAASAQAAPVSKEAYALAVHYADGRTNYRVLRPTGGGSWTPTFPRVPRAETSRNGLPLAALDLAHEVDDQDVVVTVSLLYGSPHQDRVTVATVRVTKNRPVRVDELTRHGVEPITLSLVSVPPALVYPLTVTCASGALAVNVDPAEPGVPAYRMALTNLSAHALVAFQFAAYRGDDQIASGRRKTFRQEPLALAGGEYVCEMPASRSSVGPSDAAQEWRPLDRVAITSVMWDDGTVEGDPTPAASERAIAVGTSKQVSRVLMLVRARQQTPGATTADELRTAVDVLPISVSTREAAAVRTSLADARLLSVAQVAWAMQTGMRLAKDEVLRDIDGFRRAHPSGDPDAFERWLARSAREYEAWLGRIARYVR